MDQGTEALLLWLKRLKFRSATCGCSVEFEQKNVGGKALARNCFCVVFASILVFAGPIVLAQTSPSTTPTTNVGSTANSNVQHLDLTLVNIPTTWLGGTGISAGGGTLSLASAGQIVSAACSDPSNKTALARLSKDSYALINIIRLKDPDANKAQSVASNNWYIF